MQVKTLRFGEIAVEPSSLLEVPRGLLGFPEERRYCLLEAGNGAPVQWLQSVERPELAFLVISPHEFFPGYEVYLDDEAVAELGLARPEEAAILALLSIQEDKSVTANLVGPIVVNTRTRQGLQVVLDADRYSTRHALDARDLAPAPA